MLGAVIQAIKSAGRSLSLVKGVWNPVLSVKRPTKITAFFTQEESPWTLPRTLDLLFSRNRLNVAVSRAMCLAFIVARPRLLESRARMIEQMRLINALCRFAEMAGEQ